ncbi:hypothetical protein MesoLjLa_59150 [Mesorhizobium sp. L-2-11]|nr:hypothetical protein MesoLjLa_59150 [Mesorhizobium sp. L-2-11]
MPDSQFIGELSPAGGINMSEESLRLTSRQRKFARVERCSISETRSNTPSIEQSQCSEATIDGAAGIGPSGVIAGSKERKRVGVPT